MTGCNSRTIGTPIEGGIGIPIEIGSTLTEEEFYRYVDRLANLADRASREKMAVLELGTRSGGSTIAMLPVVFNHGGTITCVDWWKGNIGVDDTEVEGMAGAKERFMTIAHRFPETITVMSMSTDQALATLEGQEFDYIFIDADHRYSQVSKDIASCKKLVRIGGILSGHDCEARFENGKAIKCDGTMFGDADDVREQMEIVKEEDMRDGVHCGVVLAVDELIPEYAITDGIWATRRVGPDEWRAV